MIYRYLQLNKTSTQNDMLHYKMCVQANGVSHVNILLEIDFFPASPIAFLLANTGRHLILKSSTLVISKYKRYTTNMCV